MFVYFCSSSKRLILYVVTLSDTFRGRSDRDASLQVQLLQKHFRQSVSGKTAGWPVEQGCLHYHDEGREKRLGVVSTINNLLTAFVPPFLFYQRMNLWTSPCAQFDWPSVILTSSATLHFFSLFNCHAHIKTVRITQQHSAQEQCMPRTPYQRTQ